METTAPPALRQKQVLVFSRTEAILFGYSHVEITPHGKGYRAALFMGDKELKALTGIEYGEVQEVVDRLIGKAT